MLRARFAPSPTGDLHLGGAWTALAAWAVARAEGGTTVLRLEDIDTPRVVAGSAARIADDLAWLGLDWDEGPDVGGPYASYTQSERTSIYEAALQHLAAAGLTYPCDCSRAEIARVASAPHPGEEAVYPGTCRDASPRRPFKRPPATRLRLPEDARVAFDDAVHGLTKQHVGRAVSDFVLRRGDGVFAYQLVVAVDDAQMGITHVVRADNLLLSTPRQILLMSMLGYESGRLPTYAHVPLVVEPDGDRLSKRTRGATIRALRERGIRAEEVTATLAHGLGLAAGDARSMTPGDVARALQPPMKWRKEAWPMPRAWSE